MSAPKRAPGSDEFRIRMILAEQRTAIVNKIEDCALHVLATEGDEGGALTAAVLRQAAEIARWTVYDPPPAPTPEPTP